MIQNMISVGSGPQKCPGSMSSETGYDPGCSCKFKKKNLKKERN